MQKLNFALLLAVAVCTQAVYAQQPTVVEKKGASSETTVDQSRISPLLRDLRDGKIRQPMQGNMAEKNASSPSAAAKIAATANNATTGKPVREAYMPFVIKNGKVSVKIIAENVDNITTAYLNSLGLEQVEKYNNTIITGWVNPQQIDALAKIPGLISVNNIPRPIMHVGKATSQGDSALAAAVTRRNFGVTGKGVKIGVISDSYNRTKGGGGAAEGVRKGELPGVGNPNGYTTPVQVLLEGDSGFFYIDEGRALLEIIHDIAPGATLAFASLKSFTDAAMAESIKMLADANCDIIVDDLSVSEPLYQDGLGSRAIDAFTAKGGSYFSVVGNIGYDAYESKFVPCSQQKGAKGGIVHDFDPSDKVSARQRIFFPPLHGFALTLDWADLYGSVNAGKGAATDININVYDSIGKLVYASDLNNLKGDPTESVEIFNEDSSRSLILYIEFEIRSGKIPPAIKYVFNSSGNGVKVDFLNNKSTACGHPTARTCNAVGSVFYQQTPAYGVNPPVVEDYSSGGQSVIYFDTNGASAKETRYKPDFCAVDGTNTSFFPPAGYDPENDGLPNFFGTSAAAPHAAAVAALVKEANPKLTPKDIRAVLIASCIDMDKPSTPGFDKGYDDNTGYGLIQASKAVAIAKSYKPNSRVAPEMECTFFPNPVQRELNIILPAAMRTGADKIVYNLYAIDGKLVRSGNLNAEGTNKIDMNDLQAGAYNLEVIAGSVIQVQKIVKQ